MIKAVIFDCFGVLYPDVYWTIIHMYSTDFDAQRNYFHDLIRRADSGIIDKETLWDELSDALGITRATLDGDIDHLNGLDKSFMQYVYELKNKGYKTSLISNIGQDSMERIFYDYDLDQYFDDTVLSSSVNLLKPNPAIFKLAADRLELSPEECVFTDDVADNIKGAKEAGMQTILFTHYKDFKNQLDTLLQQAT